MLTAEEKRARARAYYAAHREEARARYLANRQARLEYQYEWNENHKVDRKRHARKWCQIHKSEIKARRDAKKTTSKAQPTTKQSKPVVTNQVVTKQPVVTNNPTIAQYKVFIRLLSLMDRAEKAKSKYTVIKTLYKVYYMTLNEVANNNITDMQAEEIVSTIADRIAKLSKGLSALRIKALEDLARIEVTEKTNKPVKPVVMKPVVTKPYRVNKSSGHRDEKFSFDMVGIKVGEVLQWTDDPTVLVKVVGDKEVLYKGKRWSLSALDQKLAKTSYGRQGPRYFTYRGKTLVQLRAEAGL